MSGQTNTTDSASLFTLEKLKEYALEHNYEILNSELEIKKSNAIKWETTAMGLPQVSSELNFKSFPKIPTTLLPGEIFGGSGQIPVQFGSKYNADWGLSISQLVFSGEYIVGLKASKIYLDLSKKAKEKSILDIKENIEKTFWLILITDEGISAMDSVYTKTKELLNEQQKLYEAGFMEETEVEQLRLSLKNTENTLISLRKNKDIFYRLLKFQIGMDYKAPLNIDGSLNDVVKEIENFGFYPEEINIYENPDYQIMQVQEKLARLSVQREKTKFLPSLYAFYSYSENAMKDSINIFSDNTTWYPTSLWGVTVSVPIFSSGQRYSKVKQAQFDLEQKQNTLLQIEQALNMEAEQAKSDFLVGLNNVKNSSEQRHLAKKIYENSYKKFEAGMEQSFILTQNQTQYFNALSSYYQALGDLIEKNIKLKKLMNEL